MASTGEQKEEKMISDLSNQGKSDGVECIRSAGVP